MPTIKDVIVKKPSDAERVLCETWPTWGCDVSEFDWEYTQTETCLLIEGEVTVTDVPDSGESVSFAAGDYVVFPVGLRCNWNVTKAVKKYYDFS